MQRLEGRGTMNFSATDRGTLEKWLKARCQWSDNVFDDPGYSQFYKSYFGWFCNKGTYTDGDIDHELNIGHYEAVYDDDFSYDEIDKNITPYIDFIPSDMTSFGIENAVATYPYVDQDRAREIYSRTCMVILPGSNHSNANYLYKRICESLTDLKGFSIPYVGNIDTKFKPSYKQFKFELSKESVYNFVHFVSTTDYRCHQVLANHISYHNSEQNVDIDNRHNNSNKVETIGHPTKTNNKSKTPELDMIDRTLDVLSKEIDRYCKLIQYIWNYSMIPFINSNDCNTLNYMTEYDYWVFEEYMLSQHVFRVMYASLQRLLARKRYLTK